MSVDQNVRTAVLIPYTFDALDDECETPAVLLSLLTLSESAGTPPLNVEIKSKS